MTIAPDFRAAQAVLDAFHKELSPDNQPGGLPAALRAAADQVVPGDAPRPSANSDYHLMQWSKSLDQYAQRQQTRTELLAIAAELEGQLWRGALLCAEPLDVVVKRVDHTT